MKKQETGEIPVIHTALTANKRPKVYEKNKLPSMTIPGQSMTIQEMVARHRKGLPIDQSKGALYQDEREDPLKNLDHMDLIDRQAYIDSVADKLVEVRDRLDKEAKNKEQKAFLKKVDEAMREELKKINSKNQITDIQEEKE